MLNKATYIYTRPSNEVESESKLVPFINYKKPAPQRSLDMLLAKHRGKAFQTEVIMPSVKWASIPILRKKLSECTILLITDGGLVPKGNPDMFPATNAAFFKAYSLENVLTLDASSYEISHQGYDYSFVEDDPNRLLPVDVLRQMEEQMQIRALYDAYITTTGVMTSTERSRKLGIQIANYVKSLPVDAVIITSACGTSTRCGAIIGSCIEAVGIPVVQVTNLDQIARNNGVYRVIKGNNICYPLGDPFLSETREYIYRFQLVEKALALLTETL